MEVTPALLAKLVSLSSASASDVPQEGHRLPLQVKAGQIKLNSVSVGLLIG